MAALQGILATSIAPQIEAGPVRAAQTASQSIPGGDPVGETGDFPARASRSGPTQDVVKVQLEPPGEIAVYQFVDQQGTVVLQVPPQQWIEIAAQISKELAQEAAPKVSALGEGRKDNGR